MQLAALALPADPPRFAFVPDATAMQQQEAGAARRRAVAPIESRDAFRRGADERLVAVGVFGRGVGPVGDQREMQIAFRAREVMDLQPLDLLVDGLQRRQQRRHRDERAQMRGNAVAQLQSRAEASRRNRRLTPRLTSATAASMAGIAPRTPSRPRTARPSPGRGETRAAARQEGSRRREQSPSHSRRCQAPVAAGAGHLSQRRAISRSPPQSRGGRPQADDSPDRRRRVLARPSEPACRFATRRETRRAMSSSVRFEPRASSSIALR